MSTLERRRLEEEAKEADEVTPLRVLSLGAGVQSTTLALMVAAGELPSIDCAIFADTGEEPAAVYRHLDWLMEPGRLPFPIHCVTAWGGYGKPSIKAPLGDEILAAARGTGRAGSDSRPPFYSLGADGSKGMIRRQCTGDYKIDVIQAKERALLGLKKRARWPNEIRIEQWIGISTDEASRMKPPTVSRRRGGRQVQEAHPTIRGRWPLIERGMSRADCLAWLKARGYPIPSKSSCTFCPFHSDAEWRQLRDTDPEGWSRAIEIDDAIRTGLTSKSLSGALFLHASRVPLREVDLRTSEERGQINLFENECAGVCGV